MSKLLDKILSRENMLEAYNQVKSNKGSAGIDGITIEEIDDYIRQSWRLTKELIKQRKYKPQPVLRVEIPKPNGGIRQLGIPTVKDRMVQQAIVQVISPICEPHFSDTSYGFRPNRSCEKAIITADTICMDLNLSFKTIGENLPKRSSNNFMMI